METRVQNAVSALDRLLEDEVSSAKGEERVEFVQDVLQQVQTELNKKSSYWVAIIAALRYLRNDSFTKRFAIHEARLVLEEQVGKAYQCPDCGSVQSGLSVEEGDEVECFWGGCGRDSFLATEENQHKRFPTQEVD